MYLDLNPSKGLVQDYYWLTSHFTMKLENHMIFTNNKWTSFNPSLAILIKVGRKIIYAYKFNPNCQAFCLLNW